MSGKIADAGSGTATSPAEFSRRLRQRAAALGLPQQPTAFARWFNRQSGERPVTAAAVRKWMLGETCPAHSRLLALARLLEVDPTWLRFGTGETREAPRPAAPLLAEGALIDIYLRLPDCDRQLLLQLAAGLLRARS